MVIEKTERHILRVTSKVFSSIKVHYSLMELGLVVNRWHFCWSILTKKKR